MRLPSWLAFVRRGDIVLLLAVILLVIFGGAVLYSIGTSAETLDLSRFRTQAVAAGLGFLAIVILSLIDYRIFQSYAMVIYGAGILLLGLVLVFGVDIRGTRGWFLVGSAQFQPVEFAKPLFILSLAYFFSSRSREMKSWRTIAQSAALMAGYVGLVLLQPDLGSAIVMVCVWLGMLLGTQIGWRRFGVIIGILAVGAVLAFQFGLKGYQRDRILVFLNRDDPKYALDEGYNITQSIIAIGSGQWKGRGLGLGSQSRLNFLPEQESDFIFSVIAEELGFVGAVVVLGLYGVVILRTARVARRAQDDFGVFASWGVLTMIAVQVFINVGMNMGLAPVTGIPLPFLSSGGSALLANLASIGLVESIILRQKKLTLY